MIDYISFIMWGNMVGWSIPFHIGMPVVQNSQHGQSDWDTHQFSTLAGARAE